MGCVVLCVCVCVCVCVRCLTRRLLSFFRCRLMALLDAPMPLLPLPALPASNSDTAIAEWTEETISCSATTSTSTAAVAATEAPCVTSAA